MKDNKIELKCADLVQENYKKTLFDLVNARNFLDIYKDERDVFNEYLNEEYQDLNHYEDFFEYVGQYGLCFDYVEPNTFKDQEIGYFRWQLSWGGPGDEFRIYMDGSNIDYIEYWYLDWFDGASICIDDDIIYNICNDLILLNGYNIKNRGEL